MTSLEKKKQRDTKILEEQEDKFSGLGPGEEFVIGDFILSGKLRNSEFSPVYIGSDKNSQENVAVKVVTLKNSLSMKFLEYEARVFKELSSEDYIYKMYKSGTQGKLIFLASEVPGTTLDELLKRCKGFGLKTVILIVLSCLDVIEKLHKKRFLMRDVRPNNISVGYGEKSKIFYIQDFFHAKKYWNPIKQTHIAYKEGKEFRSPPKFSSLNAHLGIEMSRRDDLEMLSYTMLFLMKKQLPWEQEATQGKSEDRYEEVLKKKGFITPEDMFDGCPFEFSVMLKYARSLRFEEKPDYNWLKNNFRELYKKMNFKMDNEYDWMKFDAVQAEA